MKTKSSAAPEHILQLLEAHKRHPGEPHLRDILKREFDEAQTRPRNEALEKWGPKIEAEISRERYQDYRQKGPELDMD